MATIKLFMGILLFTFTSVFGMFGRIHIKPYNTAPRPRNNQELLRARLRATALEELMVRERLNNRGARIEEYLRTVGLKPGNPYCAAFVSWVFAKNGLAKPRSGWSPDLFPYARLARSALPGNVIGIYFPEKKRIAHVGLIIGSDGDWLDLVEANTNVAGSREGDGVYRKKRHIKTIYRIADWLDKEGGVK